MKKTNNLFSLEQVLNIITGKLYSSMDDIYQFFDTVVDEGVMTHMLPNCRKAIMPLLTAKFPDLPIDGYYPQFEQLPEATKAFFRTNYGNATMSDEVIPVTLTDLEKKEFWQNYGELPSLLATMGSKA